MVVIFRALCGMVREEYTPTIHSKSVLLRKRPVPRYGNPHNHTRGPHSVGKIMARYLVPLRWLGTRMPQMSFTSCIWKIQKTVSIHVPSYQLALGLKPI